MGKRNCVGQALAIKELSAILGHLILRYKIASKDGSKVNIQFSQKLVTTINPQIELRVTIRLMNQAKSKYEKKLDYQQSSFF